jgi:Domain of unknown function (DUF5655)
MSWEFTECGRTLKNANQWHCCINQYIDNLFENKNSELVYVFDKILSQVVDFNDVEISATKNCIVFFKAQTFLVIKPMKSVLDIKFYLPEPFDRFPFYKITKYGKQHEHHIRISTVDEVNDTILKFIKLSHDLFNPKK